MSDLRHDLTAYLLLMIAFVTLVWGVHTMIKASRNGSVPHPWPRAFPWLLGLFLICTVTVIFGFIGVSVLMDQTEQVSWGEFALVVQAAIWPIAALWFWAREDEIR